MTKLFRLAGAIIAGTGGLSLALGRCPRPGGGLPGGPGPGRRACHRPGRHLNGRLAARLPVNLHAEQSGVWRDGSVW